MSRRTSHEAAAAAASAASEAARVLQARQQESLRSEQPAEPAPPPAEKKTDHTPPPQIRRGNPERESRMEEIRRARGEKDPEEEPPQPTEAPKPPEPPKAEEPTQTPEAPVETPPAIEPPKTVRVKVDGQEFDVPEAEVEAAGGVQAYQREKAAENRLKEAREALAESKRIQAQMLEWQRQQQTPPTPPISDADFIKEKMDIIRFGTQEEGAAALLEIQQRNRADHGQIVSQATASLKHDMAMAQFRKDYADIFANPLLADLAVMQIQKNLAPLVKNGQPDWEKLSQVDFPKFFSIIGNQVRSVAGRPSQPAVTTTAPATTGATQPGPTSQVSEKEARKAASIVNLPTAAARAVQPEEPKPETRQEQINRMRKSRGLPTI